MSSFYSDDAETLSYIHAFFTSFGRCFLGVGLFGDSSTIDAVQRFCSNVRLKEVVHYASREELEGFARRPDLLIVDCDDAEAMGVIDTARELFGSQFLLVLAVGKNPSRGKVAIAHRADDFIFVSESTVMTRALEDALFVCCFRRISRLWISDRLSVGTKEAVEEFLKVAPRPPRSCWDRFCGALCCSKKRVWRKKGHALVISANEDRSLLKFVISCRVGKITPVDLQSHLRIEDQLDTIRFLTVDVVLVDLDMAVALAERLVTWLRRFQNSRSLYVIGYAPFCSRGLVKGLFNMGLTAVICRGFNETRIQTVFKYLVRNAVRRSTRLRHVFSRPRAAMINLDTHVDNVLMSSICPNESAVFSADPTKEKPVASSFDALSGHYYATVDYTVPSRELAITEDIVASVSSEPPSGLHSPALSGRRTVTLRTTRLSHDDFFFSPPDVSMASCTLEAVAVNNPCGNDEDTYTMAYPLSIPWGDTVAKVGLFAVFDGHNGDAVALFCKAQLAAFVVESLGEQLLSAAPDIDGDDAFDVLEASIKDAVRALQKAIVAELPDCSGDCGSTVAMALMWRTRLVVANAGDSCAHVVWLKQSQKLRTFDAFVEHSTANPDEVLRIREAGGHVFNNRLSGVLMPTRGLGDTDFVPAGFSHEVHVERCDLQSMQLSHPGQPDEGCSRLVMMLATDGFWKDLQPLSLQQAIKSRLPDFACRSTLAGTALLEIAESLTLSATRTDDSTCLLLFLSHCEVEDHADGASKF